MSIQVSKIQSVTNTMRPALRMNDCPVLISIILIYLHIPERFWETNQEADNLSNQIEILPVIPLKLQKSNSDQEFLSPDI